MAQIKYIGVKSFAPDLWYGSGKCWNGNGDVQEVTEGQAKRLLNHPDEFARVDEPVKAAEPEKAPIDVDALRAMPVEKMSKDELEAYALAFFKIQLDKRRSRKVLVDEVAALVAAGTGKTDGSAA